MTEVRAAAGTSNDALPSSIRRAATVLVKLQHHRGWWESEFLTNVTWDAEDIFLRHFLGVADRDTVGQTADWIREHQRDEGGWPTYYNGPVDLSTTVEAYVALRLAGDDPRAGHMARAAAVVRGSGGLARVRPRFTGFWLASLGLAPWKRMPPTPPELVLIPPRMPGSIYSLASWKRLVFVPFSVNCSHRPIRSTGISVPELAAPAAASGPAPGATRRRPQLISPSRAMLTVLAAYERRPWGSLHERARSRALCWILTHQETDGSWGGMYVPTAQAAIALVLSGYSLEHPAVSRALRALEAFSSRDEVGRRVEVSHGPVWDTALALRALLEAPGGILSGAGAQNAARFLLDREVRRRGDWAIRRPRTAPGGWSFQFVNTRYPDIDDTAAVALALRSWAAPGVSAAVDEAVRRAVPWVMGLQGRDGGWGAFDADNRYDAASADVTAHALELLGREGHAGSSAVARGIAWLRSKQTRSGSWAGRWGVNHLYGTSAVLQGLAACGVGSADTMVASAAEWLERCQNLDGGWGEDIRSYYDDGYVGVGPSTSSQTAWAILGLLASGGGGAVVSRGIAYLLATQGEDGGWEEPCYLGTHFPDSQLRLFSHYGLYRLVFPLLALSRYAAVP